MPLITFLHDLLNMLIHIANKIELQKKKCNDSNRTIALGSTQPLAEMSTRRYFWE
jgi:hypothetical protein